MNAGDLVWSKLEAAGVKITKGGLIWICRLAEGDPVWDAFKGDLLKTGRVTSAAAYSKEELEAAEFLVMMARGHHGFPQLESSWMHVYDAAGLCQRCGIHDRQVAPFRLRGEFSARNTQFLQLNWVFDEYFVRNPIADTMKNEGITGIEWLVPVIHKSALHSSEVAQMKVETTLKPAMLVNDLQRVTCMPMNEERHTSHDARPLLFCGRVKFHKKNVGPLRFDRVAFAQAPDVVKTAEWFGSGGSAFRLALVSQKLYRLIATSGWRGVGFEPVELVG